MTIVETVTEFNNMISTIGDRDVLIYPILTDTKIHPAMNSVCILAVLCEDDLFILPFNHNDAINLDINLLNKLSFSGKVNTPSKKVLNHVMPHLANVYDIDSMEYLQSGHVTESANFLTPCHKRFYQLYDKQLRVNKSVPLMRHLEFIESYFAHLKQFECQYDRSYTFLNDTAIPALQYLESTGIHIDTDVMDIRYGTKLNRYVSNNLLYSEYNLFTITGRPSNKFGGVNFAALNKKDGSRKMYTSRFDRGVIVMADYESFHLRLIADMIGFTFPLDIPVHEYLGCQYFNKQTLTEDEYNESKQITFRLLYGEERDGNVPDFFKAVYRYIDSLMVLFDRQGYIVSPYYNRKLFKDRMENPTPSKIFNYMVQLAETEVNLTAINKLKSLFDGKQSKPTLYTYDSILFDYNIDDGKELLLSAIEILSQNSKFPMRVYFGSNYDGMKRLNM